MIAPEDRRVSDRRKIGGARRGKIFTLDKSLLHCPPIANVWCDFISVLRDDTQIDE